VEPTRLTVAESITLSLEASVAPGTSVALPELAAVSGEWAVVDLGDDEPRLSEDGGTIFRRWARLEPFLSGTQEIPPFSIGFEVGGNRHTLMTDPVSVQVQSLLPEDYERLEIEGIYPPEYPPRRFPLWLVALGAASLAGAGAALLLLGRRRGKAVPAPLDPPHLVALRELEGLRAEDLVASGEVKAFYQRITAILRRYIEDSCGVRAPELTTEEFLQEVQRGEVFQLELAEMLKRFLEHCDLVKFAELEPAKADVESTYSSCRRFVLATAPMEANRAV
jgi:hypothetical protein